MAVLRVLGESVQVEYSKPNAGFRQVPPDSHLHCRKTIIREHIGTSNDGQDIDACRKASNGRNVGGR